MNRMLLFYLLLRRFERFDFEALGVRGERLLEYSKDSSCGCTLTLGTCRVIYVSYYGLSWMWTAITFWIRQQHSWKNDQSEISTLRNEIAKLENNTSDQEEMLKQCHTKPGKLQPEVSPLLNLVYPCWKKH